MRLPKYRHLRYDQPLGRRRHLTEWANAVSEATHQSVFGVTSNDYLGTSNLVILLTNGIPFSTGTGPVGFMQGQLYFIDPPGTTVVVPRGVDHSVPYWMRFVDTVGIDGLALPAYTLHKSPTDATTNQSPVTIHPEQAVMLGVGSSPTLVVELLRKHIPAYRITTTDNLTELLESLHGV